MLISIILLVVFVFIFYYYWKFINVVNADIPTYPGALPLIGHLHLLLGNHAHLWKFIVKISKNSIDNGGCVSMFLGPLGFVVLSNPDDVIAMVNTNPEKHYVYSFTKPWLGNGLLTANVQTWLKHRKQIYPMFGQQYLNSFLGIFNNQARKLVNRYAEKAGIGDFDHEPDALVTGLETICQTAIGADVGEQLTSNKEYVNAINGMLRVLVSRFILVWHHLQPIFDMSSLRKKQDEHLEVIDELSKELLPKRKSQFDPDLKIAVGHTDETMPFIDYLFTKQVEGDDITERDIHDHINTLIVSGYETSATAIVYCLMLMGSHKEKQEKLYKEIREWYESSDRDVDKSDFSKLIYLDAVIKETLRLYPVIPMVVRTLTTDVKLRKYNLKAGTNCIVSIRGINRHPEWGPDADEFRPERWLDGTLPKNPNFWATFGLGKRYCVGKGYAMMAIKTSIIHLLRRFKVSSDISKLVLKMEILAKPYSGQHISVEKRTA